MKKIIAVTSCPTGIAHTYMAAEALEIKAKELGYEAKVETWGAVGIENILTEEDIREADAVIIAVATKVDLERFSGKKLIQVPVEEAVHHPEELILQSLSANVFLDFRSTLRRKHEDGKGLYQHVMNGVSFMIPFALAGGLLMTISYWLGYGDENPLARVLMEIGKGSAFTLMIPVLAGYIAYSIADRPGLAPGMIVGMIAADHGTGFLGGIVAGLTAGYTVYYLKKIIKLPQSLQGIVPMLILPLAGTVVAGAVDILVIAWPMGIIMAAVVNWLNGLDALPAELLGACIGIMMAVDIGGPINKAAYVFSVGLLASGVYMPMAAAMAGGMVPPLAIALAATLAKSKFTEEEKKAAKAAWVLGATFITEGAIPFAAQDPARVIPSIVLGSGLAGALSMAFRCELRAPHGGIFVIPFVSNSGGFVLALAAGTIFAALLLALLKKRPMA